ncbi:MAG: segregation/condensation protein A [Phycisphaerales bacterium]|jgi:segregation and condensation protein A|nr:segregation/condensation protein A [Phycisphaerales bacterium]
MILPQEQFRVSLEAFDGPLDLLLYLVRRAEVDIQDIDISQVTDEYLAVLRHATTIDIDMAGEFLVMAATLIEIKSRTLVPADQQAEVEAESETDEGTLDPREDLIRQLLAFQRIRTAGEELESRKAHFGLRYRARIQVRAIEVQEEPALELDDVHILDLADAYEHIASAIDFARIGEHHIELDDTPIELCQEDLLDRIHRSTSGMITLSSTFEGLKSSERVGMFLAALELVRMGKVTLSQESAWGEITIAPRGE